MATPCPLALAGRAARLVRASTKSAHAQSFLQTTAPLVSRPLAAANGQRSFGGSAPLFKKRKIAAASNSPPPSQKPPSSSSNSSSSSNASSESVSEWSHEEPLDLTSLTSAWEAIDAHHKAQLMTVLHGGRFDPAHISALPVTVKPDSSSSSSSPSSSGNDAGSGGTGGTFPLGELAQVVPRSGRAISLLVNDRAYIKPIMSAVQQSPDFNQQPQRSPDNELELLLRVELERKEDLQRRARDAAQAWRDRVRQARSRHDKTLKDWLRRGLVLPDVGARVERELQKAQDKKLKDIGAEEGRALKQLERN